MNVKLVDLLMDDVSSTIKKHIEPLGFKVSFSTLRSITDVSYYNIHKKVKILWILPCYKRIAEIRYSLVPYLNVDIAKYEDLESLKPAIEELERDLRGRGFLDRWTSVNVNVGVKL